MKLKYLGTAAAEGTPGPFCDCEVCRIAREVRGREIRSRSQALVNDCLLMDLGPDTFMHSVLYGLDLTKIRSCLLTHNHEDHLDESELEMNFCFYAHPPKDSPKFHVYGSSAAKESCARLWSNPKCLTEYHHRLPFEPFTPVEGITATALKATHGAPDPYVYIIDDGTSSMLYAHDTGMLPEESWSWMRENLKKPLRLVSFDCTEGNRAELGYDGHMGMPLCKVFRERLREAGALDEKTVCVLNHFSHNGITPLYRDLQPIAEQEGFLVSYDGMEIEFY